MVFYFTVHNTNNEIQTVLLIRSENFVYFCFMPINKNAYRRYKVIDLCLRNKMRTYPNMNDLLAAIEEKLDDAFARYLDMDRAQEQDDIFMPH